MSSGNLLEKVKQLRKITGVGFKIARMQSMKQKEILKSQ